jgi:serine/threonine-protein kinase
MESAGLAPGTVVGGQYRIESVLGAGSAGVVHRAIRSDGVRVALKLLHGDALRREDLRRRFEREAKALAAAAHPNVLSVLELGQDASGLYLVTELLEGRTLESLVQESRLAPDLALAIADQILAGLGHAHSLGILHRDVKPENVYLERTSSGMRAKLLDFGLAKFHDQTTWGQQSMLTQEGTLLGSPAYMAPEAVFGPTVDARTDVYSSGVLLFELLTGTWPFVAEEIVDILRMHAIDPAPPLSAARPDVTFHPDLEKLIARALAKRPEDRWADANEMRAALARVPRPAATAR